MVIDLELIEIFPSGPLSHRKALAVTIFFLQLAVVTFFETSLKNNTQSCNFPFLHFDEFGF